MTNAYLAVIALSCTLDYDSAFCKASCLPAKYKHNHVYFEFHATDHFELIYLYEVF